MPGAALLDPGTTERLEVERRVEGIMPGDAGELRARTTMVMVRDEAEWRIVHEHLSALTENG